MKRKLGGATIEKVEELCAAGFRPNRMFPRFDQQAFDAQKHWMVPEHVQEGTDRLIGGNGNDLYTVDNIADVVVEQAGGGVVVPDPGEILPPLGEIGMGEGHRVDAGFRARRAD